MRAPKGPAPWRANPDPYKTRGDAHVVRWQPVVCTAEDQNIQGRGRCQGSQLSMERNVSVVIPAREPFFLRQSFPSVRMNGKREKKGGDAHLDMSLAESPLYLILLSNVEIGLEGGDR